MSCYDDNPLTTSQQYEEDCRLGLGHLAGKAGERELCPKCKGSDPARRSFMAESWESVIAAFQKPRVKARFAALPPGYDSVPSWTDEDVKDFGRLVAKVTRWKTRGATVLRKGSLPIDEWEAVAEDKLLAAIKQEIENAKSA
jgi:hypothetical protein